MKLKSLLETAGVAHHPKAKQLIALDEGFKEAQTEFAQASSPGEAQERINQFRDLVNRNQVQGNERNIDFWRKQGWEQFNAFVSTKSQEKSKTQEKRSKSEGRSITIHEDPNWLVVVPIDKDASCFHGKNTDWCTTKPYAPYFEQYFYDNQITLIYFLQLDTGNKWAIAAHTDTDKVEMFDKQDKAIDGDTFKQQTGFDPIEYRNKVLGSEEVKTKSAESRQIYRDAITRIKAKQPFTEVDPQLERDLLFVKDAELIVDYCKAAKGRWIEAEKIIAVSGVIGEYVKRVLGGKRLPEIEKLIRAPDGVYSYVQRILKRRWPDREPIILQDPILTLEYVMNFTLEYDDETGSEYNDWLEAETTIIKNASTAADYATHVLRSRWREAEPTIIKDPYAAYRYAKDAMRRRWPEAEPEIKQYPSLWNRYKKQFGIRD